jgi:hypothetical protein
VPEDYDAFRTILVDKPIAFYPSLARLFGGINEALFFQQIAYWSGRGADPEWIYKTREELEAETCLSRYQQEQARKSLVKLGVLEETKRGLPAKLYYRIIWTRLYELYGAAAKDARNSQPTKRDPDNQAGKDASFSQPSMRVTGQLAGEELPSRDASNSPAITESTSETTQRETFLIPELGVSSDMAWHALLEAVESRATFPRSEIDTWLRPARLAGRDGDALLIAAPNAVARDRLDARMLPQLRAVAAATFGAQIALRVVVG